MTLRWWGAAQTLFCARSWRLTTPFLSLAVQIEARNYRLDVQAHNNEGLLRELTHLLDYLHVHQEVVPPLLNLPAFCCSC